MPMLGALTNTAATLKREFAIATAKKRGCTFLKMKKRALRSCTQQPAINKTQRVTIPSVTCTASVAIPVKPFKISAGVASGLLIQVQP